MRPPLTGHNNTVEQIAVSPVGPYAATASNDFTVPIWDLETSRSRQTLVGHRERPLHVCFSIDGRLLASASEGGEALVWEVETGQQLLTFNEFCGVKLTAIQFVGPHTLVAVGDRYRSLEDAGAAIGTWRAD